MMSAPTTESSAVAAQTMPNVADKNANNNGSDEGSDSGAGTAAAAAAAAAAVGVSAAVVPADATIDQLSSTNVFAFGLQSYSGFSNEGENGTAGSPPSGAVSGSGVTGAAGAADWQGSADGATAGAAGAAVGAAAAAVGEDESAGAVLSEGDDAAALAMAGLSVQGDSSDGDADGSGAVGAGVDAAGNSVGLTMAAGMAPGQMYPNGAVDPYMYLNNLGMGGPLPPQLSAHAAYMSLPNNIVPNVNFLGGPQGGVGGAAPGAGGPFANGVAHMGAMNAYGIPGLDGAHLVGGGANGNGALMAHGHGHGHHHGGRRNNHGHGHGHGMQNGGALMAAPGQMGGMALANGGGNSLCKFFAQGHCARGEHCGYAHMPAGAKMMMGGPQMQQGGGGRQRNQPRADGMYNGNGAGPKGERGYGRGGRSGQGMQPNGGGRGHKYGRGGHMGHQNGYGHPAGPYGHPHQGGRGPRMSHAQQQQAAAQHQQHMHNLNAMAAAQAQYDPSMMQMNGMGGVAAAAGEGGPNGQQLGMLGLGATDKNGNAVFDPATGAPTNTLLTSLGGATGGMVPGAAGTVADMTAMHSMAFHPMHGGGPGPMHAMHPAAAAHHAAMHGMMGPGMMHPAAMQVQGIDGNMHDPSGARDPMQPFDGMQAQAQAHHGGGHNGAHHNGGHHGHGGHHHNGGGHHHGHGHHHNGGHHGHHGHHGGHSHGHHGGHHGHGHGHGHYNHHHHNGNSNGAANSTNSPMSDFLSKFTAQSSPEELTGHIYLIAKDQYGCRLLQRMLDEQKPLICDLTFGEVFEHMNELMTDPFGNYLCQKLIEHCNESQRFAIIQKVAPDLVAISLNMHGTRAVQKLVESIHTAAEVELVTSALRSSVVTLIKDLNGNHVIQRCLHHLSSKDNQFIYDAVSRCCVSVATHKHGCCVLQRTIDYATIAQKRQLVAEVVANALELVQDQFGNYVVQYVLDLGEASIAHGVVANLLGNISSLSVQKFSSNVVEKVLELSNDKTRAKIVEELINPERLPRLLQDPFANYCVQKALAVSKKPQFERLVSVIKPHLLALRNTAFGKRIQNKILKKFPDLNITFESLDGEITPLVMNAMVSGLSSMNAGSSNGGNNNANANANGASPSGAAAPTAGKGRSSSSSAAAAATAAAAAATAAGATNAAGADEDALDGVNGAPGGMTINSPLAVGVAGLSLGVGGVTVVTATTTVAAPGAATTASYLGAAQQGQGAAAAAAAVQQQQQQQGEEAASEQSAEAETSSSTEAVAETQ